LRPGIIYSTREGKKKEALFISCKTNEKEEEAWIENDMIERADFLSLLSGCR
jgi:hypothetical protein